MQLIFSASAKYVATILAGMVGRNTVISNVSLKMCDSVISSLSFQKRTKVIKNLAPISFYGFFIEILKLFHCLLCYLSIPGTTASDKHGKAVGPRPSVDNWKPKSVE